MLKEAQRARRGLLICPYCNGVVEANAKTTIIESHTLHEGCGEVFLLVQAMKTGLRPIITTLPTGFFSGSSTFPMLEHAHTVGQFKLALFIFCEHLASSKQWLGGEFQRIVETIVGMIERSKIKSSLILAIRPVAHA